MSVHCDYHPNSKAYWDCPSCEKALCHKCVDNRVIEQNGIKNTFHFCRKCDAEVERIPFEDTVEPFWTRLPKFFLYPLKPLPLGLILIAGLLHTALPIHGFFGALLRFLIWAVVLKYSFASLTHTAGGHISTPPPVNPRTLSAEFGLVFKQIFLFLALGFLCAWATVKFGALVGLALLAFLILSLPSIIIIMVATNSVFHALNPVIFVGMAWRIGWSYLIMYLFLIFLLAAPSALWEYVLVYLPHGLQPYLVFCAKGFYTIIAYHLMGYVLFQYHEEIGYDVALDDEEFAPLADAERNPELDLLERVNMLVKDGRYDDAVILIKSETRGTIHNPDLAERFFNILKLTRKDSELAKFGSAYMDLLIKHQRKAELVEAYEELSRFGDFAVSPEAAFKVAGVLNESGRFREAVKVYNRFIKENARSPLIPKAYFLAASTINEKLSNPQKAAEILKAVLKKFPQHEIVPYVERYLARLGVQ